MLAPTSIRYYTMYQKEPCRSEIVYFSLYPANLQLFSYICKNIHQKRYIFVVNKNEQKWLFVTFLIEVFPDKDHCQGVEFAVGQKGLF